MLVQKRARTHLANISQTSLTEISEKISDTFIDSLKCDI